ncbi:MAG: alpha/beta hydrolase [Clostridia bacterium]|nr:alpha/beta hydrolase [Clostridia bacterium]
MIYETIKLWDEHPEATLTSYCPDMTKELHLTPRKTVIVCPGGGYHFLSDREAEPIAFRFMAAGFNAFILRYSVAPNITPWAPQIEAALAIKYLRENAEKYNIDPERIFIAGFSAGGHVAASAGTLWNHKEVRDAIGVTSGEAPEGINRPDGTILSYPVITLVHGKHKNSFKNLCAEEEPTVDSIGAFALDKSVDDGTSPAFLWHTFTDELVPVECTLQYASALAAHKIPCEVHIYPEGNHGLSLANEFVYSGKPASERPYVQNWIDHAIAWVNAFHK